jgi:hypothetical protein
MVPIGTACEGQGRRAVPEVVEPDRRERAGVQGGTGLGFGDLVMPGDLLDAPALRVVALPDGRVLRGGEIEVLGDPRGA